MLVLSRKEEQSIHVGHAIVIRVLYIGRDMVKLGLEAPREIPIHRQEIYERIYHEMQMESQSEPQTEPNATTKKPA